MVGILYPLPPTPTTSPHSLQLTMPYASDLNIFPINPSSTTLIINANLAGGASLWKSHSVFGHLGLADLKLYSQISF